MATQKDSPNLDLATAGKVQYDSIGLFFALPKSLL
jgi:hypothetical protein